jgi:sugar (pentulose or hexulose) kinase
MSRYVIGLDIGTQSTKALLCDATGRILAQHRSKYQPDTPHPSWAQQEPSVWLNAVRCCLKACVEQARAEVTGFKAGRVGGICISSLYGGAGIPVDADMRPLHPCLIWMDRRAQAQVEWVQAHVDLDRLRAVTGNHVDSYYGFTKMLWVRDNLPQVWARTQHFVPPNAWIIHALTGELAVDHSSAGNIGGVYDLAARAWSLEMLEALGIPAHMMPPRLVQSTDMVGGLLDAVAADLGLAPGTPVIAGGVDAAVASFVAGASRPGQHVTMIGTSMCWGYVTRDVDAASGLVSMPHVFAGDRDTYVFGGAITAGAAETWFRDQFCAADAARADEAGVHVHTVLDRAAAALPVGADGLVFLPYLMGERSPVWDGKASGALVGLNLFHTRTHCYRAVLEGVAYALRHNIEAGQAEGLQDALIVVGGAAQSDLWVQIIADVTGRPVLTIAENVEAAMGAALLAAIGIGLIDEAAACRGWVTLTPRAQPRPAARDAYERLFAIYIGLYPSLKKAMHSLRACAAQEVSDGA